MNTDIVNFVSQFPLPEGALKDIQAMQLKQSPVTGGVNAFVSEQQGGCPFRFEPFAVMNQKKSKSLHYSKFDTITICRFFPDRKSESIAQVFPRNELPESVLYIDPDTNEVFGTMADAYKRYLEGKSSTGTPLKKWGEIDDATIASFEYARIYTVEQIVGMSKTIWNAKFGHDFDEIYQRAELFVASKDVAKKADKQADEMVKVIDENSALKAQMQEMQAQMAQLLAQGQANKEKKKAGRPKKHIERTDDELLAEASRG